ncbi:MAG: packaged DNA stabilization protein, partial [Pseudomonadota bacterium]|nr:packaged DNA stabilization protein [Pseudomonadota bacterium]
MARWTPVPVAGGAYSDDCLPWSAQDTINYIPVNPEQEGTRSDGLLRCLPGCTTFSVTGSNSPIRGTHNAEGKFFAVSGNTLYRIAVTGLPTTLGTIPGAGRVSIAHNQVTGGNEVVIGNGTSGYVYNTTTSVFSQITDDAFVGFKVCDFVDGYIAGVEPAGRYWYISDLSGATVYNSLDRQEAETQPDKIITLIVSHREVFVLGERTGQFFRNTGDATGTFENVNGTEMEVGCAGTFAVARLDNAVMWVGHDGIGYRLNGYQPQRITTHAIEQAWSRCDMSQAFCTVFEDRGHKVWYVTCPDGKTWGYDLATGKWHRRKSYGLDRWRMNTLTLWNRKWIAGDYSNGKLYELDWAVQAENGEEMERRRTFPVAHDNQNKLTFNAIDFLFDTGLDNESYPAPAPLITPIAISGDLVDNYTDAVVSYAYTASGGVLPRGNVTITSGALPTGLSMSVAGLVTGTLTTAGTFNWTVSVTDANGTTASVVDSAVISTGYVFAVSGSTLRGNSPLAWPDTVTPGITGDLIESRAGRLFVINSAAGKVSTDSGATWTSCTGLPTAITPKSLVYA